MDSCAKTSVSTDFCIFCKNLIPSRSTLPCSTLRVSLETGGNGQSHPFAPWPECKKRSRRCSLRLRFDPFSRLRHHSTPYCCLNSADVLLLRHRADRRSQTRRLLRAELSHQSVHLRFTGLVQCAAQRYLRFTQSEILHVFQLGAHQPRGSRGP